MNFKLIKQMLANIFLPENPKDRGVWWAAVYGDAQSWT